MKILKPAGNFTAPEEGTHVGILTGVVDLGLQPATDYNTKEPVADKPQTLLLFEIVGHEQTHGSPTVMSLYANTSLHEKATLRRIVKALLGGTSEAETVINKGLSLDSVLGKAGSVNIGMSKNGRINILDVSPLMRGVVAPPPRSELILFDMDNPDMEVFGKLSDRIQRKIGQASNAPTGLALDNPAEPIVHPEKTNTRDPVNF